MENERPTQAGYGAIRQSNMPPSLEDNYKAVVKERNEIPDLSSDLRSGLGGELDNPRNHLIAQAMKGLLKRRFVVLWKKTHFGLPLAGKNMRRPFMMFSMSTLPSKLGSRHRSAERSTALRSGRQWFMRDDKG